MKTYVIEFTDDQLQALIDVIREAPLPRRITDPVLLNLQDQVNQQITTDQLAETTDNGSDKP